LFLHMLPTVLIIDDHPAYRAAARTLLEVEGYEVVGESATGHDGLEAVAALHPQLVLLDIGLPDIDGVEVAARLSELATPPMVVLVSSRDAAGYERVCGARGFIPKAELSGDAIAALC
jgi:DNA-binding NarL/FixJ family response regulator